MWLKITVALELFFYCHVLFIFYGHGAVVKIDGISIFAMCQDVTTQKKVASARRFRLIYISHNNTVDFNEMISQTCTK